MLQFSCPCLWKTFLSTSTFKRIFSRNGIKYILPLIVSPVTSLWISSLLKAILVLWIAQKAPKAYTIYKTRRKRVFVLNIKTVSRKYPENVGAFKHNQLWQVLSHAESGFKFEDIPNKVIVKAFDKESCLRNFKLRSFRNERKINVSLNQT